MGKCRRLHDYRDEMGKRALHAHAIHLRRDQLFRDTGLGDSGKELRITPFSERSVGQNSPDWLAEKRCVDEIE